MNQYKELFEKAELKTIAVDLECFEIDESGTSPKTILGLPMNVLKRFNTSHGEKVLRKKESRETLYRVYRKYYDLFTNEWNQYQCDFWSNNYLKIPDEIPKEIEKILIMLGKIDSVLRYRKYLRYLKNRSQIPDVEDFPLVFKTVEEERYYYEKAASFLKWFLDEEVMNKKIRMRKEELSEQYFFENNKFIILFPENIRDFIHESKTMKNCLWMYIEEHAIGRRTILFVRKKEKLEEVFADIEISCGGDEGVLLVEAKGRFNNPIDFDTWMFINEFSEMKNLTTDYCEDMLLDNLLV